MAVLHLILFDNSPLLLTYAERSLDSSSLSSSYFVLAQPAEALLIDDKDASASFTLPKTESRTLFWVVAELPGAG